MKVGTDNNCDIPIFKEQLCEEIRLSNVVTYNKL